MADKNSHIHDLAKMADNKKNILICILSHKINVFFIYDFVLLDKKPLLIQMMTRSRTSSGIILCMRPVNERWRYNVTSSLIGWAHKQNDPCIIWLYQVKMSYNFIQSSMR